MEESRKDGIGRVIGRRERPASASPAEPPPEVRAWIRDMAARVVSRVPKGVYRYANAEEMDRQWREWLAEGAAETARRREGERNGG